MKIRILYESEPPYGLSGKGLGRDKEVCSCGNCKDCQKRIRDRWFRASDPWETKGRREGEGKWVPSTTEKTAERTTDEIDRARQIGAIIKKELIEAYGVWKANPTKHNKKELDRIVEELPEGWDADNIIKAHELRQATPERSISPEEATWLST